MDLNAEGEIMLDRIIEVGFYIVNGNTKGDKGCKWTCIALEKASSVKIESGYMLLEVTIRI